MKKILFLSLSLLTGAVLITSCKKETNVTQQVNNAYSEGIQINPSDWTSVNNGSGTDYTYTYNVDNSAMPIDDFVFNVDGVLIYGSPDNKTYYPLMGNGTLIGSYYLYYAVSSNSSGGTVTITAAPASTSVNGAPTSSLYLNVIYIQPNYSSGGTSSVNTRDMNSVIKAYNVKKITK
jgi:hypothetical protein